MTESTHQEAKSREIAEAHSRRLDREARVGPWRAVDLVPPGLTPPQTRQFFRSWRQFIEYAVYDLAGSTINDDAEPRYLLTWLGVTYGLRESSLAVVATKAASDRAQTDEPWESSWERMHLVRLDLEQRDDGIR